MVTTDHVMEAGLGTWAVSICSAISVCMLSLACVESFADGQTLVITIVYGQHGDWPVRGRRGLFAPNVL